MLSRKFFDLHQKEGDLVKIGPDHVLVRDLPTLHLLQTQSTSSTLNKKSYCRTLQQELHRSISTQLPSICYFDNDKFSSSAVNTLRIDGDFLIGLIRSHENTFDTIINSFYSKLDRHFISNSKDVLDLHKYLQLYAYDSAYYIAFSKLPGFLEQDRDDKGIIKAAGEAQRQALAAYQAPFYQMVGQVGVDTSRTSPYLLIKQAIEQVGDLGSSQSEDNVNNLFDAVCLSMQQQESQDITKHEQISGTSTLALSSMLARNCITAETLTNTLAIIFYQLLRLQNQRILERLVAEVDNTTVLRDLTIDRRCSPQSSYFEGFEGETPLSWDALQHMPYLTAVINEAMRLYPPTEMLDEYEISDGPLMVSIGGKEQHIQQGVKVVFCTQAILCDERIFGPDVNQFIPDRWLTVETDKREEMDKCLLTMWGVCNNPGVDTVYLLVTHAASKLIPAVLRRFKLNLSNTSEISLPETDALSPTSHLNVFLERRNIA